MLIGTLLLQLTFVLLADTDNFCIESTKGCVLSNITFYCVKFKICVFLIAVSMNETLSSKAVNGKRFVLVTFMKVKSIHFCPFGALDF